MKLVFPGGEHPQVLLGQGVNRIGSDPLANIVLNRPGVRPQHCQMHVTSSGVMLDVPVGTSVSVNGREVNGLISLRAGDNVAFDGVLARLSSMDSVAAVHHQAGNPASQPAPANDDPGVTAVRQVLPRFVLRGVSGTVFGRSVPLHGTTTIGRAEDCNLHIDESGLSRHHARMIPTGDGIQLEDLGSTNGTFINGKRILRALAKAGDEIGFDSVRFRLSASGQPDTAVVAAPASVDPPTSVGSARALRLAWVLGAAAGIAAVVAFVAMR